MDEEREGSEEDEEKMERRTEGREEYSIRYNSICIIVYNNI